MRESYRDGAAFQLRCVYVVYAIPKMPMRSVCGGRARLDAGTVLD